MYQMNMVPKGFLYTSVLSMYWEGKNVQIHLTINSCNVVTRHSFFIKIKITITWAEWAIIWQKKMKKYIYVHFLVWVYLFIFWFIPYTLHIPRNNCDAYLVTYYYYILIRLYIWSFDWFQMTSEKYKYVVDEWSRKKNIYLLLFPDVRFFYQSFWFEKKQRLWYAKLWYYVVFTNWRQK